MNEFEKVENTNDNLKKANDAGGDFEKDDGGNLAENSRENFESKELFSPAERIGELLAEQLKNDPHFYFFSPDETTSNRFTKVFEVEKRAWNLPREKWDLPESENGRIIEMLSENVLFSVMTGHLLNGEKAMMGSYEAFFPIITSQLLQQMKFIKQSKKVAWRKPLSAVNLLSTSTCWRQDHNGFTHQSPALISTLLSHPGNLANCLFPVDDLGAEEAFSFMISSVNAVNFTTFNKNPLPRYEGRKRRAESADNEAKASAGVKFDGESETAPKLASAEINDEPGTPKLAGAEIFEAISDENPDFVFTAAGDIVSREATKAMEILREDLPGIRLRFVNINALSYRAIGTTENKLSPEKFAEIFTPDRPILANFHGYPETLAAILENYASRGRIRVHGFIEEGSTTTPFEMLRRNKASRFDLAMEVAGAIGRKDLVEKYRGILAENHRHAVETEEDLIKD